MWNFEPVTGVPSASEPRDAPEVLVSEDDGRNVVFDAVVAQR